MKTRKRPLLTQAILTDILLMTKQQQQQALFTFRFRIIIVTEGTGSFSLTVRYIQCNKRKTKSTLHVRKCLASK